MPEVQAPLPLPKSQPFFGCRHSTILKLLGVGGGGVRTFMICAGLAGVFFYITLQQQDYALLMGAIALFVVLAIVMYVTRKVDWYARDTG